MKRGRFNISTRRLLVALILLVVQGPSAEASLCLRSTVKNLAQESGVAAPIETVGRSRMARLVALASKLTKESATSVVDKTKKYGKDIGTRGFLPATGSRLIDAFVAKTLPEEFEQGASILSRVDVKPGQPILQKTASFLMNPIHNTLQLPVRKVSKLISKDAAEYEVTPLRYFFAKLDRALLGPELKWTKKATFVRDMAILSVPLAGLAMLVEHLNDREVRRLIDQDPRFSSLRDLEKSGELTSEQTIAFARSLFTVYNDFRYRDIRMALESAREEMTNRKDRAQLDISAVTAANQRLLALTTLIKRLKEMDAKGEEASMKTVRDLTIGETPTENPELPVTKQLYQGILPFLTGEYQGFDKYEISAKQAGKPLTRFQIKEIFELESAKYLMFENLSLWFGNPPRLDGLKKNATYKRLYEDLKDKNPMIKDLLKWRTEGKLKQERFLYYLMEEVYRQIEFREEAVAGATLRKWDGSRYSDEPASLNDFRNEVRQEIIHSN